MRVSCAVLMTLVCWMVGAGCAPVLAQTPVVPYPDLELTQGGAISAMARQPDGGLIIGGYFHSVNGVRRSNIARLLPNGEVDLVWNPGADRQVDHLAVNGQGDVFAAGAFTQIGGRSKRYLAKLSGTGTGAANSAWNPNPDSQLYALLVDGAGSVFISGNFSSINGVPRRVIAKLNGGGSGAMMQGWNSPMVLNDSITTLAVDDAAGFLYIGGAFYAVGGHPRQGIARISIASGAADPVWNPGLSGYVRSLEVAGNGSVYLGGMFTQAGGQPRNNIARLSGTGSGAAESWDPSADGLVTGILAHTDGSIYVDGEFSNIGGQQRRWMARIAESGTAHEWNPVFQGGVRSILPEGQGVVVGGGFDRVDGVQRLGLARVTQNGELGPATDAGFPGVANVMVRQPDGGVIVGGDFKKAGGLERNNLLRLHPDGRLDLDWAPQASHPVLALATGADGAVFVGGQFTSINGLPRSYLAKLSGSGNLDSDWKPASSALVRVLLRDADNLYAGGSFTSIDGVVRNRIARLSVNGSGQLDSWNPSINNDVYSMAKGVGSSIYVGGAFTTVSGFTRERIARLDSGSTQPDGWRMDASGVVRALVYDGSGWVYAAGDFTTIAGAANQRYLAKLSDFSGLSPWNPSPNGSLEALALDGMGNLYAAGRFSMLGSTSRQRVARFDPEGTLSNWGATFPTPTETALSNIRTVLLDGTGLVYLGGVMTHVGSADRWGFAALPVAVHSLRYSAGSNGSIIGEAEQTVIHSRSGTPVTAQPDSGYHFQQWSDGVIANPRTDTGVMADISVVATFANQAPQMVALPAQQMLEDTPVQLLVQVSDLESPALDLVLTVTSSDPALLADPQVTAGPSDGERLLTLVPAADAHGPLKLTLMLRDPAGASSQQQVVVQITPVNDAPLLTLGSVPVHAAATTGVQSVPGFATVVLGPPDEQASQSVQAFLIDAVDDPAGVVQVGSVSITTQGTLGYALSGVGGTAAVTVRVRDDGGTANGGTDTSVAQQFSLGVVPSADLQISKDNGSNALVNGQSTLYEIVVSNAGPNAVTGAVLSDPLPGTLIEGIWHCVAAQSTASCPSPAAGAGDLQTSVALAAGQQLTFELSAIVDGSKGAFVTNSASITGPAGISELDPGDNSATDEDPIVPDGLFRNGFEGGSAKMQRDRPR